VTVEQAKQRLLVLIEENNGSVAAATIEADEELAENQQVASAAARMLATEPEIVTGDETDDSPGWFPYSVLLRADQAAPSSPLSHQPSR
jgi:hypothetical protein